MPSLRDSAIPYDLRKMIEDYSALKQTIEAAGFHTTFMPIDKPGDRMVCVSHRYSSGERAGGLGGISFWVAKRGDDWFIATWSGVVYRVPDEQRHAALCLELLGRQDRGALCDSDLDQNIRDRFALTEAEDFDSLPS
jgi:hypothetical protein